MPQAREVKRMPTLKGNYGFWLMPEEKAKAHAHLQQVIDRLALKEDALSFEPHLSLSALSTERLKDPKEALRALISQSSPPHPTQSQSNLWQPLYTVGFPAL